MSTPSPQQVAKIDALMEQAHQALVKRRYFECEAVSASALRKAHSILDYDRMARILMPLQEARRQKRDLALDAVRVTVLAAEMPPPDALQAGCYLVCPPRVGVDGRAMREAADDREVPTVVLVREPTSRDGLWPVVAVGPVTIRAKVRPPELISVEELEASRKGAKKRGGKRAASADSPLVPPPRWFVEASEQLGDQAIASVDMRLPAHLRVDMLLERLEALPDHEKLHQALEAACRQALKEPLRKRKPGDEFYEADEFDDGDDGDEDE